MQRIPGINRLPFASARTASNSSCALLLLLVWRHSSVNAFRYRGYLAGEKENPKLILTLKDKKWEIDLLELGYDGKEILLLINTVDSTLEKN